MSSLYWTIDEMRFLEYALSVTVLCCIYPGLLCKYCSQLEVVNVCILYLGWH